MQALEFPFGLAQIAGVVYCVAVRVGVETLRLMDIN